MRNYLLGWVHGFLGCALIWASGVYAADVTLRWVYDSPTAPIQGFKLRMKPEGGAWSDVATIPPGDRQYRHVNVPTDVYLLYKLTAFNADGESMADFVWGSSQTEPPGPPAAPNTVTVTVSMP